MAFERESHAGLAKGKSRISVNVTVAAEPEWSHHDESQCDTAAGVGGRESKQILPCLGGPTYLATYHPPYHGHALAAGRNRHQRHSLVART